MHLTFDARGHLVAFAFFAAILLILAVPFLLHLRRRPGSRGVKLAAFLTFAALYIGALYAWLFWRTFFELRASHAAGRVELELIVPERQVAWPLEQVVSIHGRHGSKVGVRHLVLVTRDGRHYESPPLSPDELRRALDALRPLGKDR